jgi:hypothetical protein
LITADTSKTTTIIPKLIDPLLKPCQTVRTIHRTGYFGTWKLNGMNVPIKMKNSKLNKFWEELITYFPLIQLGLYRGGVFSVVCPEFI